MPDAVRVPACLVESAARLGIASAMTVGPEWVRELIRQGDERAAVQLDAMAVLLETPVRLDRGLERGDRHRDSRLVRQYPRECRADHVRCERAHLAERDVPQVSCHGDEPTVLSEPERES